MSLLALAAAANPVSSVAGVSEPASEAGALTGNTGFTFPNDGKTIVRICVGAAGAGNYTAVHADGTTDAPVALSNSTIYKFGPYDPSIYSTNGGLVQVNLSVVTGNTVGVYKAPQSTGFNHLHMPMNPTPGATES